MTRQDFIDYLVLNGCEVVREAPSGYSVLRHAATKQLSGVPETDPPNHPTVCRICKTLGIAPPNVSSHAIEIIDQADKIAESKD